MFIDLTIYDKDKLIAGYYKEDANIIDIQNILRNLYKIYLDQSVKEIERKYNEIYK